MVEQGGKSGSATNLRVPHPSRFCKGWDPTAFDLRISEPNRRISLGFVVPTLRRKREGWGTRRFAAESDFEIWSTLWSLLRESALGSVYTAGMYQIRAATPADAAIITHHRRRMFVDAGRQDNRVLDVMAEHFKPWVESRLGDGRYLGWLTTESGQVVAGAGLIVLDWPPHPLDPRQDKRGYLLNVYVEPEHRRKKLASHLIDQALAEARKQKIRVVALHSTDEGRPLYESNGFRRTNEMFYVEPVEG
jgi:ribosomal protein S18 acetylase RimI-like enzyme